MDLVQELGVLDGERRLVEQRADDIDVFGRERQAVVAQRLIPKADGTGRVAAFEIMIGTSAVRAMIREGKTHLLLNSIETSQRDGMLSMDRAVTDLVRARAVTVEEGARYMRNPAALKSLALE